MGLEIFDDPDTASVHSIRNVLSLERFNDTLDALRWFAYTEGKLEHSNYTLDLIARDISIVVAREGKLVSSDAAAKQTDDESKRSAIMAFIQTRQPYSLSARGQIPQAVHALRSVQKYFDSVKYDVIGLSTTASLDMFFCSFVDHRYNQSVGIKSSFPQTPRWTIVMPRDTPGIKIIDTAAGTIRKYDRHSLSTEIAELLQAHFMIAAASVTLEVDRSNAVETSTLRDMFGDFDFDKVSLL